MTEIERLRQELAIREESEQEKCIEYLRQENIDWEDMYRTLANENAKLREQLDYMTPIAWYAASERERDRMRELGIGVCEC